MKSTNYYSTLIEVAEDCPVIIAEVPLQKDPTKTIATLQFEMLKNNPYKYTSDELLFMVHVIRNNIPDKDLIHEQEVFFSNGQPCFRSSPLPKRYGWGVHSDDKGRIGLVAVESEAYMSLAKNKHIKHVKAMRTRRKST
ncbi:MAG: DUF6157 family protein [Balneolaceae bacterium]|nr:DUF6157 family protein [Balneolaceae bacterium]